MELEERFWSKVDWDNNEPERCWHWKAGKLPNGYGMFWIKEVENNVAAHRIAYELEVDDIEEWLVIDHTCHDPVTCAGGKTCLHRLCCNPNHLRTVFHGENSARDRSHSFNREKTHCPQGHEYTPDTTYYYPETGHRRCRRCH